MRQAVLATLLLSLSLAALAQTATVRVQGKTLDTAGIEGTVQGNFTVTGSFSQMNITGWNLMVNGATFNPSNSSYAGQISGSLLLRPTLTVRAFYFVAFDGRVLWLMVPASFFRDADVVGDKVSIFPVGVDVVGNSLMVYGSGVYHASYSPVVQITSAHMSIVKIRP